MAFIRLELIEEGGPVYVNCDHINFFYPDQSDEREWTHIQTFDSWCEVKESPEAIVGLIKLAKFNEKELLK